MIRTGIAGWIDRSLIESRAFYPPGCTTSEQRLHHYASQFDMVEVDSSYYGMPVRRNSEMWVARTPPSFRFDVKSFSLFTHHPTNPRALPPEIRAMLPPDLLRSRSIYLDRTPPEVVDAAWDAFHDALEPLRDAGRLGAVFFQFPPWFVPKRSALAYIETCQERMHGFQVAVEFRRPAWLDDEHRDGTEAFLRRLGIPYVAVDTPQGLETSLPPLSAVTSPKLAVVRFHGRNRETWTVRGAPPNLRFRHDYGDDELLEWVPRLRRMEEEAEEVHAIFNNNYSDYSVRNARSLRRLLAS